MITDKKYMRIAIGLAKRAEGMTSPNPLVGAVVVKNGRVVGKGYHKRCGAPHAEVNAIKAAGKEASAGAALYVTLEPCDHYGRTAPCTDAVIKSGIKRVVIGMKDPNPLNNGRGIARLKDAGIKTSVGILEDEANVLNRPYIKFITTKMPYVTLKIAESLDGKIATRTGDSRWITSEASRRRVRALRSRVDAVMVGAKTAARDDPLLLGAASGKRQPIRIIVDSRLKIPLDSRIFSSLGKSPVILATTEKAPRAKVKDFLKKGASIITCRAKGGRVDLKDLFKKLGMMGVTHVLAEGGGELAAGLLEEGLVDKVAFFIAPKIIGGALAKTGVEGEGTARLKDAIGLKEMKVSVSGQDLLVEAEVV